MITEVWFNRFDYSKDVFYIKDNDLYYTHIRRINETPKLPKKISEEKPITEILFRKNLIDKILGTGLIVLYTTNKRGKSKEIDKIGGYRQFETIIMLIKSNIIH